MAVFRANIHQFARYKISNLTTWADYLVNLIPNSLVYPI